MAEQGWGGTKGAAIWKCKCISATPIEVLIYIYLATGGIALSPPLIPPQYPNQCSTANVYQRLWSCALWMIIKYMYSSGGVERKKKGELCSKPVWSAHEGWVGVGD